MLIFCRAILIIGLLFWCTLCIFGQDKSTKLKIIKKPQPTFTEEARKSGVTGKVVLKVEFKADETIGEIEVIDDRTDAQMEKYGLVNEAVKATRKIKFKAAKENGSPVTQTKIIVMEFFQ